MALNRSVTPTNDPAASRADTPAKNLFSNDQIGAVAGEIWQRLAKESEQSLAARKKSNSAPADLVMAAIGWLAREGKLHFRTSGRTVKVSLRQSCPRCDEFVWFPHIHAPVLRPCHPIRGRVPTLTSRGTALYDLAGRPFLGMTR